MKFWAKVRLNGEKDAGEVIIAFFREFNSNSRIEVKGKEAILEIVFEKNPPLATIHAISNCEIIEFSFGNALKEEEVSEAKVEKQEQETGQEKEEAKPNVKNEIVVQNSNPEKKRRGRTYAKQLNPEDINIPILDEIAKQSTSFEHFVKSVAEWLGMNKKQQFFEDLVMVASEVDEISWNNVENALKDKGIICTQWDRIYIGQRISEKLKEYSITMMPLLVAMKKYKGYFFGKEHPEGETLIQVKEQQNAPRVKMDCMPDITEFEEILGNVDKTRPIEQRVMYVLNSMGLKEKDAKEQQEIFEIASAAVVMEKVIWDDLFSMLNIPIGLRLERRLKFSKFIDDFVSQYDSEKKVKSETFLKELQKILIIKRET